MAVIGAKPQSTVRALAGVASRLASHCRYPERLYPGARLSVHAPSCRGCKGGSGTSMSACSSTTRASRANSFGNGSRSSTRAWPASMTGRKRHVTIRASRGHEPSPRGRRRAIRRLARIDELRAQHGTASKSGAARPLSRTRQRRHHPRNGRTRPGEILQLPIAPGGVAEWSKAAVLKTAVLEGTRGSNPFSSAPPAVRGRSHC